MTSAQRWLLAGVVVLAAFLRFAALERVPYGVNQDEASRAYDAYSLLQTGHDQHGNPWPLTLESFSRFRDNASAIAVYAALPTTALLGPGVLAVRIPSAIAGVLAVAGLAYVGYALSRRWSVGILAAFILAVSPWHLTLSRTGHEAVWATTLFTLGLAAFLRGMQRPRWLILAAVAWAATLYGYPIAKLFVPLAALGFAVVYWPELRRQLRWVAVAVGVGVVLLIPMLAHQLSLPDAGRLNEILIFSPGKPAWFPALAMNVSRYVNPFDWFGARTSAGPLDWIAVLLGIPLFFISARAMSMRRGMLVLVTGVLFLSIIPAVVTDSNPNQLRASYLVMWIALVGAWGLTALWSRVPRRTATHPGMQVSLLAGACVLAVLGLTWFSKPAYALRQGYARAYMPYTPLAADVVRLLEEKYAAVPKVYVVNNNLNQPQVFFQLFRPWPPAELTHDIHITLKEDFWYFTKQLGRYTFCHIGECPAGGSDGIYVQLATKPALGATVLDALRLPAPVSNYAWYITHD